MSIIKKIRSRFNTLRLVSDERGLSTVEYVILLVLIAALCVATWNALGKEIKAKLGAAGDQISGQTQDGMDNSASGLNPSSGTQGP